MTPPDLLARYLDGQQVQVWQDIRRLGALGPASDRFGEVLDVCQEFARRARNNVDTLVSRMKSAGYRFHTNDPEQNPEVPHRPPGAGVVSVESFLGERFGAVPLTVLLWLRTVGDVWLVGTHPDWPGSAAADPLVLELEGSRYPGHSIVTYFEDELDEWDHVEPFVLPLSPDRLHKANISGGAPFGILLPDGCADGLFVGERTTTFVDYLNQVFHGGGFAAPPRTAGETALRRELAAGLLPL